MKLQCKVDIDCMFQIEYHFKITLIPNKTFLLSQTPSPRETKSLFQCDGSPWCPLSLNQTKVSGVFYGFLVNN